MKTTLKSGDLVKFKKPWKWVDGRVFDGSYRILGFAPDAMGRKYAFFQDIPGAYPLSRFIKTEVNP